MTGRGNGNIGRLIGTRATMVGAVRLVTRYAGSADGIGTTFVDVPDTLADGATILPVSPDGPVSSDAVKVRLRDGSLIHTISGEKEPRSATCTKISWRDPGRATMPTKDRIGP